MCIAILNPPGITIESDILYNCWSNNDDGAGMVWVNNGKLEVFKELVSFKSYAEKYSEVRKEFPESHIVLHFRITTSGKSNIENTHPFFVNENLAMVHNGIIRELELGEPWSDTYYLSKMLQTFPDGWLESEGVMNMLSSYIEGSKLILLNNKNEYWIVNADAGEWMDGCWWSNSTYSFCYYGYNKVGTSCDTGLSEYRHYFENCSECDQPLKTYTEEKLGVCLPCLYDIKDTLYSRFIKNASKIAHKGKEVT
jgi:hypothetical protein